MTPEQSGRNGRNGFDPGTREILKELRDLRVEMRADRREAAEDRRQYAEAQARYAEERRQADRRFEQLLSDFRQDSIRREAETRKMFKELRADIRSVGMAIVTTLNRHTRLLVGIDRKLGARNNGRGPGNGRNA